MAAPLSIEDARRLVREAVGARVANQDLSTDTRFEELGLTSLDLAEIFFAIEGYLDVELEPIAAGDPTTLGELLDQINAMAARASDATAT
jgi:acyl carrier protein